MIPGSQHLSETKATTTLQFVVFYSKDIHFDPLEVALAFFIYSTAFQTCIVNDRNSALFSSSVLAPLHKGCGIVTMLHIIDLINQPYTMYFFTSFTDYKFPKSVN